MYQIVRVVRSIIFVRSAITDLLWPMEDVFNVLFKIVLPVLPLPPAVFATDCISLVLLVNVFFVRHLVWLAIVMVHVLPAWNLSILRHSMELVYLVKILTVLHVNPILSPVWPVWVVILSIQMENVLIPVLLLYVHLATQITPESAQFVFKVTTSIWQAIPVSNVMEHQLVFNASKLTPVFVFFVTMDSTCQVITIVSVVLHTAVLVLVLLTVWLLNKF